MATVLYIKSNGGCRRALRAAARVRQPDDTCAAADRQRVSFSRLLRCKGQKKFWARGATHRFGHTDGWQRRRGIEGMMWRRLQCSSRPEQLPGGEAEETSIWPVVRAAMDKCTIRQEAGTTRGSKAHGAERGGETGDTEKPIFSAQCA